MAEGQSKKLNTKATLAGGGAGTVWLALANQIPDTYPFWKTLATYAAPGISVALTAIWVLTAAWLLRKKRRHDVDSALSRARTTRDRVCNDPHASVEHKAKVCAAFEKFEMLSLELIQAEFDDAVKAELKP